MTKSLLPNVLCIMGPTASGKTSLAIDAAKALNGEVVSVDSALIYKHMDIGTAKPDEAEQQGIKHHLIDIVEPDQSYSVGDFFKDAQTAIDKIVAKNKLPILAGGTMMYFNAIIKGINTLPKSDLASREKVQALIDEKGLDGAHNILKEIDPRSAKRLHPNDSQRITRALEVFFSSSKTLSEWQKADKQPLSANFITSSIAPIERSYLHELIEKRFDLMLTHNFIEEVEKLEKQYQLNDDMPSMRSVGYRQVRQYLRGELDYGQMRERAIIATRQLAKRQLTWLRGWEVDVQLETQASSNLSQVIEIVNAHTKIIG